MKGQTELKRGGSSEQHLVLLPRKCSVGPRTRLVGCRCDNSGTAVRGTKQQFPNLLWLDPRQERGDTSDECTSNQGAGERKMGRQDGRLLPVVCSFFRLIEVRTTESNIFFRQEKWYCFQCPNAPLHVDGDRTDTDVPGQRALELQKTRA